MGINILPKNHQVELPIDKLILNNQPDTDETVPMDVVIVGGGPAGLSCAIELSKLIQQSDELNDIEIAVLEKAENLGGHNLSGAVINPMAFKELFPELKEEDFPFIQKVNSDEVHYLTAKGSTRIPTPPTMHNKGNSIGSICQVVRWLGEKAESYGVNMLSSFPADALLVKDNKFIEGVRTVPAGLDREGKASDQSMPATDIKAKVTVLAEGTRGTLTQTYMDWQNIQPDSPQIFALGVKELWKVKQPQKNVIHTMGWPLSTDTFGGSFCYPQGDDKVALGLVAGLDYKQSNLDVHLQLQKLKQHPLFKKLLQGGELLEWGAKTIPEGGLHSVPKRLSGDGLLMVGDAVGFVNVPALKGIHYAMLSGIYAARSIFEALKAEDYSAEKLASYDNSVKSSIIYKDLNKVKNMRHAFKDGFFVGGAKAALMTVLGGSFGVKGPFPGDNEEEKNYCASEDNPLGVSKVDAVYLSGNKTRDDIPSHLTVGKDVSAEVADFYSSLCPAGVYEKQGDKLVVNAPNCVDCKATDVIGPRWQPREGGSGPDYKNM